MKIKIIILINICFLNYNISACDICGCGIAGSNINGILPQFNKNIYGFRFSYNSFKHPNTPDNYIDNERVLKDHYYSYDAWFRYYPTKRIQTIITLPYKNIIREKSNLNNIINGLGDANIFANYSALKINDSSSQKYMWWIGTGLKLNTGKYQQRNIDKTMYPVGLQTGNGAYAVYFNNQLTYKKDKLIINSVSQYMMNFKNELDFQMGNVLSSQLQLYYQTRKGCSNYVLPHISLEYISVQKDKSYGLTNMQSGSNTASINIGIDWFINSFFVSATLKQPYTFNTYTSQTIQQLNGLVNIGYIVK
jgi:hypothetical protein